MGRHLRESAAARSRRLNILGYEARYLANRHRIPNKIASELVERIGRNRIRLDLAAREWIAAHRTNDDGTG
jgi:hypothetical protein